PHTHTHTHTHTVSRSSIVKFSGSSTHFITGQRHHVLLRARNQLSEKKRYTHQTQTHPHTHTHTPHHTHTTHTDTHSMLTLLPTSHTDQWTALGQTAEKHSKRKSY